MTFVKNTYDELNQLKFNGWKLKEFDEFKMTFWLNFSEPVMVSSSSIKDKVIIEILEPRIF